MMNIVDVWYRSRSIDGPMVPASAVMERLDCLPVNAETVMQSQRSKYLVAPFPRLQVKGDERVKIRSERGRLKVSRSAETRDWPAALGSGLGLFQSARKGNRSG